jgi:septal ring factor EnvC (AmiA/AmiB activator)
MQPSYIGCYDRIGTYSQPRFALELLATGFYCRTMKRISLLLAALLLCGISKVQADDAATEERLNQLSGKIEDLIAGQEAQRKQLSELRREIDSLREQASKPTGNFAAQEDLKRLADNVKEVDRKRLDDYEKIRTTIKDLGKTLVASSPSTPSHKVKSDGESTEAPKTNKQAASDKGFEHIVKSGDTLSGIITAYREQNIKVNKEQIMAANPGLVPEKMRLGQKIWIPAPQQ